MGIQVSQTSFKLLETNHAGPRYAALRRARRVFEQTRPKGEKSHGNRILAFPDFPAAKEWALTRQQHSFPAVNDAG